MKFDVAIIGAGPAGSWLAGELAKNKISVVLFERSSIIGEPNFSSAGSPAYTVERFNLPREAVAAEWDAIKVIGPNSEKEWQFGKVVGVVLDFRKLKKLLIKEAIKNGAEVVLGTAVESTENRGEYSYVRAKSLEEDYGAKIIVDASGPAGVIAVSAGIRKRIPILPSVGIELIVEANHIPEEDCRTLVFFSETTWRRTDTAGYFPCGRPP